MRYTTDGTTPSATAGTLYSVPFAVSATTTVNAIAYESGMTASPVVSATFTISSSTGPAWYNSGWSSRKPVTVNHTQVSAPSGLVNFPILFSVTDPNLCSLASGGEVGKLDGTDILFTASDGVTKLNHEIETYNPTTGQLVAWVNIPSLSATTDTLLYVYFGNASAANQQTQQAVWDGSFVGVWHLADNASNPSVADSTSYADTGTARASTSSKTTAGQIGGALNFNGATDYITVPNSSSLDIATNTSVTMEAWVNVAAFTTSSQVLGYILGKGYEQDAEAYFLRLENDGGTLNLRAGMNNSSAFAATWQISNWNAGTWHHVVGGWDGSNWNLYFDGVLKAQTRTGNGPLKMGLPLTLGAESISGMPSGLLDCTLDEIRLSNVMRSAGWIATEYSNQSSPATFYSIGTLQSAPN
jgi:hypothetical protein